MLTNTIIANCGEGNVGKTGSILLLYAKLRKAAGMDVPDGLLERNEDICEEVTINGIRVGNELRGVRIEENGITI